MNVEVIPKHIKFNKMANKQPLFEHEGGNLTNSSNEIELKVHEACCKNETQKVTHYLLRRRNDIDAALWANSLIGPWRN